MSRQIIKWFLIWFFGFVIPILLFIHYYFGYSLFDKEFWQLVFLESLVFLNFIYLCLLLKKIDLVYAISFATVFWFAGFLYMQIYKNIDSRIQSIQILAVLIVMTIVVRFILKKSSPR